jgi:hypothetical protein
MPMPRLLDLFCGRWGWSRAFAARGWECEDAQLSHSQMSTFEQPVETAKVNGNGAAEDARELSVSILPRFDANSHGDEIGMQLRKEQHEAKNQLN